MNPLSQITGNGGWLEFQELCCSFVCLQCKNNCILEDWEDDKGNVTFSDIIEVLMDLTGPFMSDKQREDVLCQLLQQTGYTRESSLLLDDIIKILDHESLKWRWKSQLINQA